MEHRPGEDGSKMLRRLQVFSQPGGYSISAPDRCDDQFELQFELQFWVHPKVPSCTGPVVVSR